jgi:acetylglutamate kinase
LESIVIIKIGGNIIDDPFALNLFLHDFAKIKGSKVLVHGGGKMATQISKALGIETKMIDGRRITDEQTIDVVTMVYGGLINKKIVAKLQSLQCNAIGLTGADANIIEAHKRTHPGVDYGFVGDIDLVHINFLLELLEQNKVPVLAPITHDKQGNLLNTNADTVASSVAVHLSKLKKVTFIYCFEKAGLLENIQDENSVIPALTIRQVEQLKEKQIITDGMLPKVQNIVRALEDGVDKVILCHAQNVLSIVDENANFGTTFTKN